MKNKYKTGQVIKSRSYNDFEIIEYVGNRKYRVKFIDTGYIAIANTSQIIRGEVRDMFYPSVAGVGFLGDEIKRPTKHPLYRRWCEMLNRCYDKSSISYNRYGAKGITVCDEWFCFNQFVKDISEKENYSNLISEKRRWHLDKDILNDGSNQYNKNTVSIILASSNSSEANKRRWQCDCVIGLFKNEAEHLISILPNDEISLKIKKQIITVIEI